ncbi:hypothetical protein K1T71_010105 [Dendrolimus kikuchii]|uniref:Uncharacterized protein n=1 Tax=Dendrolimus kikuchii TaxID=765133 RepID=A0ACC1CQP8_9NEOP|nr:hypothetical protein K1T71_010105 [Dendrolimus kikuchii]
MDRNERKTNSRTHSITVDRESRFVLRKVFLDFIILFCVGFLILAYYLWGTPYKRGFFCDDESLKHPYKESSVTNVQLYIVGLGLPVLTMCLTEWIRLRDYMGSRSRTVLGKKIPPWVWEAYRVVGVFLFGCACQQLTTDVAKYTIGRLRPHFFDVCIPDIDCDLPANRWKYVEHFNCLGDNEKLKKEMRLSFPSGHSSFSAYTMLYFFIYFLDKIFNFYFFYMIQHTKIHTTLNLHPSTINPYFSFMYLQKRFTWRGSKLLKHGIQFILLLLAWYTVMTRISDYKHHWSDVMAGFAIGLLFAIVIFLFVSDLRKAPRSSRTLNLEAELHTSNGNTRGVPRAAV